MKLRLYRYGHGKNSTGSLLFVNGVFFCHVCEDEARAVKVAGETRIPAGTYRITLRTEGGMTQKYAERFPFHKGMLWLRDVPGFEYIYLHIGNTEKHTEGCLLVGFTGICTDNEFSVGRSVEAYTELYQLAALALLERGEEVTIEIVEA